MPSPTPRHSRSIARLTVLVALSLVAPLFGAIGTTGQPASRPTSKPSTQATSLPAPFKFEKEIRAMELADAKNPPPPGCVVFTGSSTIRRWTTLQKDFAGVPVVNHGFGGSMISDAVYFADRLVACKPSTIVFYSGGNDINANRTPERVCADFKAFVAKVRLSVPDVKIIFMGIGPSPKRWAQADRQKRANQLIHDYIDAGSNMKYVEVWDEMLGPDGKPREELYVADHHHNNAAGYEIRTAILKDYLK